MSLTPEQKAEINKASGFDNISIKRYPTIKFTASDNSKHSEAGSFTKLSNDEKGNLVAEDLGKELKCVFLKRGKFGMKKKPYRTNEVNRPGKFTSVEVFKTGKDGKGMRVDEGLWRDMKDKYGLSTFQYPYVMLADKDCTIAKLPILPSTLSNYWGFNDTFETTEDEIWEFETILKADDKITKGSEGEYYLMTFKKGKKLEGEALDLVAQTIKDLRDELSKADEARAEQQEESQKQFSGERPPESYGDDIPQEEVEQTMDEKVDKINAEMAGEKDNQEDDE